MYVQSEDNYDILGSREVKAYKCPNCDSVNTTTVYAMGKYTSMYGLPFSHDKIFMTATCSKCDHKTKAEDMPFLMTEIASSLRKEVKIPLRHFKGLGLLGVLLCVVILALVWESKLSDRYLEEPEVGDRYEVVLNWKDSSFFKETHYSLMKILSIDRDSITFVNNDMYTDQITGLDKIDLNENYTDWKKVISRADITKMYEEDIIKNIKRDNTFFGLLKK